MKSKVVYIGVGLLVVTVISSLLILSTPKKRVAIPPGVISTSPSPQAITDFLSVLTTDPINNQSDVAPKASIKIFFNKEPNIKEAVVSFSPSVNYSLRVVGKTLFIVPSAELNKNTRYTLSVGLKGMLSPVSIIFTIASVNPSGTGIDLKSVQEEEDNLRIKRPDIFLTRKVPLNEATFKIMVGSLKPTPTSHYSFIVVTGNDLEKARGDLNNYLDSLFLTTEQIKSLDIVYLNSSQESLILKLKNKLPYFGNHFSILYNETTNLTTISIDKNSQAFAQQQLDAYLNQLGISDKYWIDNLNIVYE